MLEKSIMSLKNEQYLSMCVRACIATDTHIEAGIYYISEHRVCTTQCWFCPVHYCNKH